MIFDTLKQKRRETMNITQVKWNTDKPFQNDVEGKLLLAKWYPDERIGIKDFRSGSGLYWKDIDWSRLSGYSVLSDEPVYCEWVDKGTYWQGCGGQWSLVYKFCPHCGLPIKVIDELKPLQLMGIEPEIVCQEGSDGHLWKYQWRLNETYITSDAFFSKREAIESWNSLVKKLTGEK
jgi:hypothetical protein